MASFLPRAEAYYPPQDCVRVTPVVAVDRQEIVAGQYRDTDGNCYIWLNIAAVRWTRARVCSAVAHEMGHLAGLQHTTNRRSVMYPSGSGPAHAEAVQEKARRASAQA